MQSWFYAIILFTTTRNGVAAKELQRQLGVTYKTAWRMAGLIREHMANVDGEHPIGGLGKTVQIDETFVGGNERGKGMTKRKTIVFGMMEMGGDIMMRVVPDRRSGTLLPIIRANVHRTTTVHTNEHHAYGGLGVMGFRHQTVNHNQDEYVSRTTGATVNRLEGFWAQLKRSINGTQIHVSGKHLWNYAKEAEYRFNRRHRPEEMFDELLRTFRPLNG